MIDLSKLRDIARNDPDLYNILIQEPAQMTEQEFLNKFSLLWNLSKKGAQK
ncbi:MAG: hypothetical protein AMDU1_APLC00008G0004 [Thermoplasmatales archaeon A-plasma]|jgi:hypothetical protein|nr:MAG: hypothetical protein AMDU1_APLC00008G0004 [Thermoplasmatales archaeon A-plasma]